MLKIDIFDRSNPLFSGKIYHKMCNTRFDESLNFSLKKFKNILNLKFNEFRKNRENCTMNNSMSDFETKRNLVTSN